MLLLSKSHSTPLGVARKEWDSLCKITRWATGVTAPEVTVGRDVSRAASGFGSETPCSEERLELKSQMRSPVAVCALSRGRLPRPGKDLEVQQERWTGRAAQGSVAGKLPLQPPPVPRWEPLTRGPPREPVSLGCDQGSVAFSARDR